MNEEYFRKLKVMKKGQTFSQEDLLETPIPIVDLLYDESTKMVYIVDYKKCRFKSAKDGYAYSDWIQFD